MNQLQRAQTLRQHAFAFLFTVLPVAARGIVVGFVVLTIGLFVSALVYNLGFPILSICTAFLSLPVAFMAMLKVPI